MDDYKELTQVELDILVDIVKKFGKLYSIYPVIGMDSTSVQLRTDELFRIAKELGIEIENRIITVSHGKYECNWFWYDGVKFQSQDTIEEYK